MKRSWFKSGIISVIMFTLSIGVTCCANSSNNVANPLTFNANKVELSSPDGKIIACVSYDSASKLVWSAQKTGEVVLHPAPLGLTIDGKYLGESVTLGKPVVREINETYPVFGHHSEALNFCNEADIPVVCADGKTFTINLRAYNDGVAVRSQVPLQNSHTINSESTAWKLPGNLPVWWARYDGSYERPCESGLVSQISSGTEISPPITIKYSDDLYVALTEANNDSFPDMGLVKDGEYFKAVFPASKNGWRHEGPIVSPWRLAIIADGLTELVTSDMVTNLCPAPSPELANADWIKPGRSLWQWWAIGAPRLNDQKQWVDAAKHLGFEYYLIDDGWRNWRAPGKDQWQLLKEVIDYGKSQGVESLVWVNSAEMRDAASRRSYLERVAALGAAGIKIDFIPACTAEITRWYEGALKDTAELKLICNFHGAVKPTGRQRTWPHELTREAVRGHEYHMTRYRRIQAADHDPTVLFTRYLAGPGDYTPTAFDPKEMVGFTWPHLLAQSVVMTSPIIHFAGKYQDFVGNPAENFLRHLPAVWDETIVLPGSEIGKVAGFARRSGQQWYIGIVNGAENVTMDIDLSFLGPGKWQADIYGENPDNPADFARETKQVTSSGKLSSAMPPRGGAVIWITKVN